MEFRRFDESMAMSFPQLLRVPINFLTRPKVHVTVAPFCESVLLDKRREQGRENQLKILDLTNSFVLFFFPTSVYIPFKPLSCVQTNHENL